MNDHDSFRANSMIDLFMDGWTLQEVGEEFGITKQRVQQIIKRAGLSRTDGGVSKRCIERKVVEGAKAEERCQRIHGCSLEQLSILKSLSPSGHGRERTPIGAFARQRCSARRRGIEWQLKLWEWWTIWQESGKWEERGQGADLYCMCRNRDLGPYAVGNVYIATNSQNGKDYHAVHGDRQAILASLRDRENHRSYTRKTVTLPKIKGLDCS